MAQDEAKSPAKPDRPRRERSTRYPGVGLAECLKLCESIEELGVDGLSAPGIASALGFTNIKTNTFSARLSGARQFGLLALARNGYALTPLARELLHPLEPTELPRLLRQALFKPPLYADLAERFAGKKVPDPAILGNILYHNHQIIASAKDAAVGAFLESAQFAGALGVDQVLRPEGVPAAPPSSGPVATVRPEGDGASPPARFAAGEKTRPGEVRLDLRLWDSDQGKTIRLRAPQSISAESFERFLQAFRLLVRIEDPSEPGTASQLVESRRPLDDPGGLA
jgi:hypothetical protein